MCLLLQGHNGNNAYKGHNGYNRFNGCNGHNGYNEHNGFIGRNGFNLSWKLCFNLCSLRWLKPTRRRINNSKPEISLVSNVPCAVGRIKSKSALQKTEYEGAWQIDVSSLFHSLIVWGKKELLKVSVLQKICLILEYLRVL